MKSNFFSTMLFLFLFLCLEGCNHTDEIIKPPPDEIPEEIPEEIPKDIPDEPEPVDYDDPDLYVEITIPEDIPDVACIPDMIEGKKGEIAGKWKLLTNNNNNADYYKPQWDIDYSCDTIIYEFLEEWRLETELSFPVEKFSPWVRTSGTLIVKSSIERFPQNVFRYEFKGNPVFHPLCGWGFTLSIEGKEYNCTVMKSVMEIFFIGTGRMFFVRIE